MTETINNTKIQDSQQKTVSGFFPAGVALDPQKLAVSKEKQEAFSLAGTMYSLSGLDNLLGEEPPADSESSFGFIGGSAVGETSKYIMEEQDLLLSISNNALTQSYEANSLLNEEANNQYNSSMNAAAEKMAAGYMEAAGLGASGLCSLVGGIQTARSTAPLVTRSLKNNATINEADATQRLLDANKPKNSNLEVGNIDKNGDRAHLISERKTQILNELNAHEKIRPLKKEQGGIVDQLDLNQAGTDGQYLDAVKEKNWFGGDRTKFIEKDWRGNPKIEKDQVKENYDKFEMDDINQLDKDSITREAISEIKGAERTTLEAKIAEKRKNASEELERDNRDINSTIQLYQMWTSALGNLAQSGMKFGSTFYTFEENQDSALAGLAGTMSNEFSSISSNWNGLARTMYDTSSSVLGNVMSAMQKASNQA